ncbi:hypothetical protein BKA56DRAFT_573488 [Ilyonectria sp. MPI-CAGE-AT-0026]|nr:hypothetical protein BKA56DRAFT_573488 [Ilyonectria sp. MPI-CAGE-AT-0026]
MIHPQSFGLRRRLGPGALVLVGGEDWQRRVPAVGIRRRRRRRRGFNLGPSGRRSVAPLHKPTPCLPHCQFCR